MHVFLAASTEAHSMLNKCSIYIWLVLIKNFYLDSHQRKCWAPNDFVYFLWNICYSIINFSIQTKDSPEGVFPSALLLPCRGTPPLAEVAIPKVANLFSFLVSYLQSSLPFRKAFNLVVGQVGVPFNGAESNFLSWFSAIESSPENEKQLSTCC